MSSMETIISKVTAGMERGAASLAAVIDDVRFGHPAEVPRISDRSLISHKIKGVFMFITVVDTNNQWSLKNMTIRAEEICI